MKTIVFFVLTLAVIIIADEGLQEEKGLQKLATFYQTDIQTIEECLNEAGITLKELHIKEQILKKILSNIDDEETKKYIATVGRFLACMLEKKDMIKDSKLDLDKMEAFENNSHLSVSKEVLQECVNKFNEDIELSQENRTFKLYMCLTDKKLQTNDKK